MPDDSFIHSLAPEAPLGRYPEALALLRATDQVLIGHVDAGVAEHPGLGYSGGIAPDNILLDDGSNFLDPEIDPQPVSPLRYGEDAGAQILEYPDHGVKTLAMLIGRSAQLHGVVPGAKVVPYRVSNGPLFRRGRGPCMSGRAATALIGEAIRQAVHTKPEIRVMSISMGNPGWLGLLDGLIRLAGGGIGMARSTGRAVDAAYEAGVILCCAAGQVIDRVVYPARYGRTIAVGGLDRRGALWDHYPPGGYAEPDRIDVWAQACRINRPSFLLDRVPPEPIFANDARNTEGDPSGTSYAAPQVAGAAALWTVLWYAELEDLFGAERWKIVEAFRAALRSSARHEPARILGSEEPQMVRVLDIPALLDTPPEPFDGGPEPEAAGQGWF